MEVVARNLVSRRGALSHQWEDNAILLIQHEGTTFARQYNVQTRLRRGDIYLMDTRASLELVVPDMSHATSIAIDRAVIASLSSRPESLFGLKVGGDQGFCRLLRHLLMGLVGDSQDYNQAQTETVMQGLRAFLGHALQIPPRIAAPLGEVDQLEEIKAWMLRSLGDPMLNVQQIAKQFGLSRSALYRLFAAEQISPMAWLTKQRLERGYQMLSEPSAGKMNVTAVCYGLGFNDPSHFSRLFRQHYGCAPRDLRRSTIVRAN
jgi:AraC-like DNA-binding protein